LKITFRGVRGSTPTPGETTRRYGGNTACVSVEAGDELIVLDLGTGVRRLGADLEGPVRATVLLTHLHFDHVQGLPFCNGLLRPGSCVELHGPTPETGVGLESALRSFLAPPLFPVTLADLPCSVGIHEVDSEWFGVGEAKVRALPVPHVGSTVGYRIEHDGASVAYVPDHQMPLDGSHEVDERVLELCTGVDLLIHDSQYTPEEFAVKSTWGHCTIDYAVEVARRASVGCLAMFHHDPTHDDATVDALLAGARERSAATGGPAIVAPAEGEVIDLSSDATVAL
jgi:phosphoribosyl 1,2-cyclic phosphodiesterase